MSGEDALAVLISGKLSRYQYDVVRRSAPDGFPSYKVVQGANCPENIQATGTSIEIPSYDLLNHTVQRLLQSIERVVATHVADSELDQLCSQNGVLMVHQDIAPTSKPSTVLKTAILVYLLHVWFHSS
ncbi:hypothetical protein JTB14_021127 [Gonioctena quinquepunctata]|nr:hypothetical protein JTB14_021127 [Gonioctena quinquepunctata]